MNKDIRNLLIALGVTVVTLFIALPKPKSKKGSTKLDNDFSIPEIGKISESELNNATIAIKAIRAAKNDNAPKSIIDELKATILKENGIRLLEKDGLFIATNRTGKEIAKEQR